jgi:hypothetical protein
MRYFPRYDKSMDMPQRFARHSLLARLKRHPMRPSPQDIGRQEDSGGIGIRLRAHLPPRIGAAFETIRELACCSYQHEFLSGGGAQSDRDR